MKGYLLDTNVLAALFTPSSPFHAAARRRLEKIDRHLVFVSAIALGEMEFGIAVGPPSNEAELAEFRRRVKTELAQVLPVGPSTAESYGELRRRLFERCSPKDTRTRKKRIEQLVDPVTAMQLTIEENDLWMASQAMETNMTFVSQDKMSAIADVGRPELMLETWF